MKATVTKYEDMEVDIDDEQIEMLMCTLLKEDYQENKDIFLVEQPELLEAMEVIYLAYSGKPIDFLDRFAN
jgi:hypothetical protein